MAKRTIPKGDTAEPLKFSVKDQRGLVDLTAAEGRITGYFQGRDDDGAVVATIVGDVVPIAPAEDGLDEDGRPIELNARYDLQAGDTDLPPAGADWPVTLTRLSYRGQIRVEWDRDGLRVETLPSGTNGEPRFFEFVVVDNLVPAGP